MRYRSTWNNGRRPPRYSCIRVNVGLLTSPGATPSPSARPRTNAVFPAPRSPNSRTTSPAESAGASSRPSAAVSWSECVVTVRTVIGIANRTSGGQETVVQRPERVFLKSNTGLLISCHRFGTFALTGVILVDDLAPRGELEHRVAEVR